MIGSLVPLWYRCMSMTISVFVGVCSLANWAVLGKGEQHYRSKQLLYLKDFGVQRLKQEHVVFNFYQVIFWGENDIPSMWSFIHSTTLSNTCFILDNVKGKLYVYVYVCVCLWGLFWLAVTAGHYSGKKR